LMRREAEVSRATGETRVRVLARLEGEGRLEGSTGIKFLDHILGLLAYHSLADLSVSAEWDLKHHGVEDLAICLGEAIGRALGGREGLARFGFAVVPMDEALAEASVDLVRRAHANIRIGLMGSRVEDMASEDIDHFLQSLAQSIPAVIHVNVRYGVNDHHRVEAAVKALALALRSAWSPDPRRRGPPSSKGVI
jgi:imidazoleglycerol-phosphate dehydratase